MIRLASAALSAALLLACAASPASAQGNMLDRAKDLFGGGSQGSSTASPSPGASLASGEIADGLREALRVGTERVVGQLGTADGFNGDPEIRIPLPPSLQRVQSALRTVGMSALADDVELKLNRAAEAATPKAKELFWQAIGDMTLDDAQAIYDGPDDAATQYFRQSMSDPLKGEMRPVIDATLAEVGAIAAYDRMMGQYAQLPLVPDVKADLTDWGLEKTLDGLFHYVAREEVAIRQNPAARTTELLQRVFGGG